MIQREMNLDLAYNAAGVTGAYVRGRDLWKKVPDFEYQTPGVTWVLSRQHLTILVLLAWTAISIGLSWSAARRLRVE